MVWVGIVWWDHELPLPFSFNFKLVWFVLQSIFFCFALFFVSSFLSSWFVFLFCFSKNNKISSWFSCFLQPCNLLSLSISPQIYHSSHVLLLSSPPTPLSIAAKNPLKSHWRSADPMFSCLDCDLYFSFLLSTACIVISLMVLNIKFECGLDLHDELWYKFRDQTIWRSFVTISHE